MKSPDWQQEKVTLMLKSRFPVTAVTVPTHPTPELAAIKANGLAAGTR